jgi:SAM-dependent methyltransferase
VDYWFLRRLQDVPCGNLLEFGCGTGFPLSRLLAPYAERRWATDLVDVPVPNRPPGVVFRKCGASSLPFDDDQFDAIVVRSVIEHVDEPIATFRELARVLRPEGRIYMNLPNKWDYVSVAARIMGSSKSSVLHRLLGMEYEDFPVRYRCNTKRAMGRTAGHAGLLIEHWRPLPSEPSYLKFFVPFYLAGAVYQFGISILSLDFLQPAFLVILRRTPDEEAHQSRALR